MTFSEPTYVVLEVPEPLAGFVRTLRQRYDPDLAPLPVEITVTGSSGVGLLAPGQEPATVYGALDSVAAATRPIRVQFVGMATFAGTGIYYFEPRDRMPFEMLQRQIVQTGLQFLESRYSFTPHLTTVKLDNPDEKLAAEVLGIPAPAADMTLRALSVYSQAGFDTRLLYQVNLTGDA